MTDPADDSAERLPGPSYLDKNWMSLRWTSWMPLMAAHPLALTQLPSEPGMYRVRRVGQPEHLVWIGWAERGVRELIERLSRQVHLPVQPYDDPHSPATLLWSVRREAGAAFEVSGAAFSGSSEEGQTQTEKLLAAYRAACGWSQDEAFPQP